MKLATPHTYQQHLKYLVTYGKRITTFSEALVIYFRSLWILSAYLRLEDAADPKVRSLLQDKVREVASCLLHKDPQHVATILKVSATVAHHFHERYLAQVATAHGSFDVAAFYELPPRLINHPHFLVPLLDSLLNEAGRVGSKVIMQQAVKLLADHPVVEAVLDWRVDDEESGGQVWLFTKLQQLDGITTMWINRADLVKEAHGPVVVEKYEEQLGAELISIRFAALDPPTDGESEVYELVAEKPTETGGNVIALRLITRAGLVRMNIPSWMALLETCESEFCRISKTEGGVRWMLTFDQVNKRRVWEQVPPTVELAIESATSECRSGVRKRLQRFLSGIGQDGDIEDAVCPCGKCHKDSHDEMVKLTKKEMDELTSKVVSSLADQLRGLALTDASLFNHADTKATLPLCSAMEQQPSTLAVGAGMAAAVFPHDNSEPVETTAGPVAQPGWDSATNIDFGIPSLLPSLDTTADPCEHSLTAVGRGEQKQQKISHAYEEDGTNVAAASWTVEDDIGMALLPSLSSFEGDAVGEGVPLSPPAVASPLQVCSDPMDIDPVDVTTPTLYAAYFRWMDAHATGRATTHTSEEHEEVINFGLPSPLARAAAAPWPVAFSSLDVEGGEEDYNEEYQPLQSSRPDAGLEHLTPGQYAPLDTSGIRWHGEMLAQVHLPPTYQPLSHEGTGAQADKAAQSEAHSRYAEEGVSGYTDQALLSQSTSSSVDATPRTSETAESHIRDAEASGRIVVKCWKDIGEEGVFAGPSGVAAGEVLGVLEGDIVQGKRRLTRPEHRRFIGIWLNDRRAHIDVGGRWSGKINHAPPSKCNVEWNPDTWQIVAMRDIQPNQQLFFDYGVGYWVDELMNKDYVKLPKDQRALFDVVHSCVRNYAWLSSTFRERKPTPSMRIGIIAFYLSQQWLSGVNGTSSRAIAAFHDTNPVVQYLLEQGLYTESETTDEPSRSLGNTKTPRRPAPLDLTLEPMATNLQSPSPFTLEQLRSAQWEPLVSPSSFLV